jgi:F-type H+-transporting ATPase subunit epsilon
MDSLRLTLVTPLKKVLEGVEVSEIRVPADKGELTIFPDHSPMVTTLDTGVLTYIAKGSSEMSKAVITWGYCEVINGEVNLLAETAEAVEKIDMDLAKKNKAEAEKDLASNKLAPEAIKAAQNKLKKANAELSLH